MDLSHNFALFLCQGYISSDNNGIREVVTWIDMVQSTPRTLGDIKCIKTLIWNLVITTYHVDLILCLCHLDYIIIFEDFMSYLIYDVLEIP